MTLHQEGGSLIDLTLLELTLGGIMLLLVLALLAMILKR
jgi:hypothetical protein